MKDWTEFGLRGGPELSARTRAVGVPPFQEMIDAIVAGYRAELEAPLRGVTADGQSVPGLFGTRRGTVDTAPLREAALAFLDALDPLDRPTVCFPSDASERREWVNVHPNFFRHGVMLENLTAPQRERGLQLLRATLSARGFAQARDIMRLNDCSPRSPAASSNTASGHTSCRFSGVRPLLNHGAGSSTATTST